MFNALQRRASDIHIETQDREVVIKYRIDGVLYNAMEPIDKQFHSTIISRIKVMSELDIAEKRIPQDGRFKLKVGGRAIDFRVSIIPTVHGEDAVIRILDKESANEEFRRSPPRRARLRGARASEAPQVHPRALWDGPGDRSDRLRKDDHAVRGALRDSSTSEDKIITIEDPVEYQLKGITQIPVNEKKGLTFSRGLALDSAPRPGQDHGRGDPRRGNGADRGSIRA